MIGEHLLERIRQDLDRVDDESFRHFVDYFLEDRRVFVCGAGRSGLVGKCFAMRLMHLGKEVYVLGETNTPAAQKGDLLLCISASGTTASVLSAAEKAAGHGVTILSLTANAEGPLPAYSQFTVLIDSADQAGEERKSASRPIPLGTAFELASLVFLESVIAEIMHLKEIGDSEMKRRHTNL